MKGRNVNFVPYRTRLRMKGEIVKATSFEGESVAGELIKISPIPVVKVEKWRREGIILYHLYNVNPNSLEILTLESLMN